MTLLARALMILLLFSSGAFAQSNLIQTGDLATRGLKESDFPRVKQLAPGVYTYEAAGPADPPGLMTTNSLIVIGKDGVIVADGQGNVPAVERMIAEIKKLTAAPIKYVVVCSDHGDHTAGNPAFKAAFPDVVFISSPVSQKALASSATPPTETVTDKRLLKVGTTEVEVLNLGRAHTGGDLSVYVPAAKVLFMSEAYFHRLFPAMRAGYPSEWLATLKKAQGIDAKWYIAGHGFVDDAPTMKAELETYRQALTAVIAEANRLYDAKAPCPSPTDCAATQQANWGAYADWTERPLQAGGAIWRVYQERDGKLN